MKSAYARRCAAVVPACLLAASILWPAAACAFRIDLVASNTDPLDPGQSMTLEVIFNDLDPAVPDIVTAYTLAITYPEQLLAPTTLTFASSGLLSPFFTDTNDTVNNPGDFIDLAFGQGVAKNRLAFTELSYDSDADIALLQQGITGLAAVIIGFDVIAHGLPEFQVIYDLSAGLDVKGAGNLPYDLAPVPLPSVTWLLVPGLILIANRGTRRCRRAS